MKKRLLDQISLDAFRVFEAAARHMNFSAAARELLVTQAAVSRRIQKLEEDLQLALFLRDGRRLDLTPAGEDLYRRVQATLDFLADGLEEIVARDDAEPIKITASGAVAHLWLGEKLRRYVLEHPQASIRLITTDNLQELARTSNDLTVLYSTGDHPQWSLAPLLAEELIPVAAPAYLERVLPGRDTSELEAEEIARLDLFDYNRVNAYWLSLRDWFQREGLDPEVIRPRVVFPNYPMAVEAALGGEGVILGSRKLLGERIAKGQLVEVSSRVLVTSYGYYLGLPRAADIRPEAMELYLWLVGQARRDR